MVNAIHSTQWRGSLFGISVIFIGAQVSIQLATDKTLQVQPDGAEAKRPESLHQSLTEVVSDQAL
jgi:hypothetical protein